MANNTLHDALAGFTGVTNIKLDSEKLEVLSKQFSEVATKIFNSRRQSNWGITEPRKSYI